jgi:hypothetical protein
MIIKAALDMMITSSRQKFHAKTRSLSMYAQKTVER